MRQIAVCVLAGIVLAASPAAARAQGSGSAATSPTVKVGVTLFYDYTFVNGPKELDADGNEFKRSAFDVSRAYLNITGNLSPLISFRITPDIKRESGLGSSLNGSLQLRIKYAYAQFNLDEWMPSGSRIRVGIHQTPFIEGIESVYRYRFQGTVFAERDGGLSSADAGVSFRGVMPSNFGDVVVGVYNGEGYSKPEVNDQKSVQARFTVRPWAKDDGLLHGLRVTAFVNNDNYLRDGVRKRFIANAVYEHRRFNAGFDFLLGNDRVQADAAKIDSKGASFFITPFFQEKGKGVEGLIRYDYFRADRDLDGVSKRVIVGGAYWFPNTGSAQAALLVDFEQVTLSGSVFANRPRQQRLAVHGLINF